MTRQPWLLAAGLALAVLAGGGARAGVPPAAGAQLAVAGRSNAFVSVANANGWSVAVWAATLPAGAGDVYAAVSRDGGASFGPPVRVNDTAGTAHVGGEQPPRVAIAPHGSGVPAITVVWTARGADGTALLRSSSSDGGRTFAAAAPVPGSVGAGNRGWEAMAAGPDGAVGVVWLDHREMVKNSTVASTHMTTTDPEAAVAMARKSKIYFAALGARSAPAVAITSGVCYCCKTALALGPGARVVAAWRQVYAGDFRDIAVAVSHDGGRSFTPPRRVHEDRWMLQGCPEDGPALTVEPGGRVDLVWPTQGPLADGSTGMVLNYASAADGLNFSPPVRIPAGNAPHHPVIALDAEGRPLVAWDEAAAAGRQVAIARVTSDAHGRPNFARLALSAAAGAFPVLAPGFAAWSTGPADHAVIHVEILQEK